jgi:hypothetical protein
VSWEQKPPDWYDTGAFGYRDACVEYLRDVNALEKSCIFDSIQCDEANSAHDTGAYTS